MGTELRELGQWRMRGPVSLLGVKALWKLTRDRTNGGAVRVAMWQHS